MNGKLDERIEQELCDLRIQATAAADAYNAAIKEQAAKLEIDPGILKKYVNAKLAGDMESLRIEAEQIETLVA